MLFNSLDFGIFLPVVFGLYWLASTRPRLQNALIVAASYVFYGWWDWRFLSLLLFSTLVDYSVGLGLSTRKSLRGRRTLLYASIAANLGVLGFFKYANFFVDNFAAAFTLLGMQFRPGSLAIVLPVGISFYTFQTMSYAIDVYRRKLEPTRDFVAFAAFVSFFPQLVAGPIERASNLLTQFTRRRTFVYAHAVDGLRQVLWGLFKKIAIADNCAVFVNQIYGNSSDYGGSTLLLGTIFFAFQIYGDFSGYSDIAIGTARLFGFRLMRNFAFPYFSRDIAEFWRRWHISLTTWFRDYVFYPLGGTLGSAWKTVRNTAIIFLVSGFWHGANWTFIAWGAVNAAAFLPMALVRIRRGHPATPRTRIAGLTGRNLLAISGTFAFTLFAWVFFRADDLPHAFAILSEIFSASIFSVPGFEGMHKSPIAFVLLILFVCIEWIGRDREYAIEKIGLTWKRPVRIAFYQALALVIVFFGGETQQFIYFQF